jgi:hypothetical protein
MQDYFDTLVIIMNDDLEQACAEAGERDIIVS